jgi:hypothetical protein
VIVNLLLLAKISESALTELLANARILVQIFTQPLVLNSSLSGTFINSFLLSINKLKRSGRS